MKKNSVIKFLFLPAILFTILLGASSCLFYIAQNIVLQKYFDPAQIPALKLSTFIQQIILVLALFFASKKVAFEKVLRWTMISLIGITALLTGITLFLDQVKCAALLFGVLNVLSFPLFSMFIWGFLNRFTSVPEGIKYYIPFAFLLGFFAAVVSKVEMLFRGASILTYIGSGVLLMIASLFLFNWAWKRLPTDFFEEEKSTVSSKIRFPYIGAAYLLAGFSMVDYLLTLSFKSQVRGLFSEPVAYGSFMGKYAMVLGISTIVVSMIWAIVGTWFLIKKGWKTALFFGLATALIGAVFLGFSIAAGSVSWLNQGIGIGILKGTKEALFFALIQILYLFSASQIRFRTKIVTEMIVVPVMAGIPASFATGLLLVFGSMQATHIYLQIFAFVLMALFVLVGRRLSSKYTQFSQVR